jgi:hypothetical protein
MAALRGDFSTATQHYPMILPLAALALGHTIVAISEVASGRHLVNSRWLTTGWLMLAGGIFSVWIVRLVLLAA